jgi:hypothetical protein
MSTSKRMTAKRRSACRRITSMTSPRARIPMTMTSLVEKAKYLEQELADQLHGDEESHAGLFYSDEEIV